MASEHVRTRYTKQQVKAIIQNGIDACNGRGPDTYGFARVFQGAIAYSLFSSIHFAYLAKSAGGTDDLGFKWVDLSPHYKAYRRKDARAGMRLDGPKGRPTLNPAQDKVWRGIYARMLHKIKGAGFISRRERSRMSPKTYRKVLKQRKGDAVQTAAGTAWAFVKDHMGAVTLIDELGNKQIPIMRDTDRLIESLEPAPLTSDGSYVPTNPDQICGTSSRVGFTTGAPNSTLIVGTRVPYAKDAAARRPIWPANMSIWMGRAIQAGSLAVTKHLAEVLR